MFFLGGGGGADFQIKIILAAIKSIAVCIHIVSFIMHILNITAHEIMSLTDSWHP